MEWLTMQRWSPYAVGIGIGILSWLTFVLSDKPIGCSTAFARTSAMIERLLRGDKVLARPYYRKFAPRIDWEWMLVLGIVVGAFVSAVFAGDLQAEWVPARWAAAFGPNAAVRIGVALAGGVLMGLGARWAGGCTSGHGISGSLQLTVSSWIAVVCFFVSGITGAMLLFKVFGA